MSETFVIARVEGQLVAFPADRVKSAIELGQVVAVARVPSHITGITTLRSRAVAVIDTARSLELTAEARQPRYAVLTERNQCTYALTVDQIESVEAAGSEIEPLRIKLSKGWKRAVPGTVETKFGTVVVLDLDALIDGPQQKLAA